MTAVALKEVDSVEVRIVIDNALDILAAPTDVAVRNALAYEWSSQEQLRAEHGYSVLITVRDGDWRETLLYDAGLGRDTVLHNLSVLGHDLSAIRAVVLSHGHADHHGGLEGLAKRLGRSRMPFVLHPDAMLDRRVVFPTGVEIHMPPPAKAAVQSEGWEIIEERTPTLLLDDRVLVTGQVTRTTDFEKGFPLQQARQGDQWVPDSWIWDDQAVVLNVRERGLVVLSSCSHAGSINVLRYAQELTGQTKIHAFIGGMHLTGGLFEAIIPQTVRELAAIAPDYVVPGHCSGWRALQMVAATLPDAYIHSNLGTSLRFGAGPF
jgi:7,8-dihydropterin-6-yl-methyl-4-(beta-D-ribofuranosyl)aminobenzene 5'-phosphate synthase